MPRVPPCGDPVPSQNPHSRSPLPALTQKGHLLRCSGPDPWSRDVSFLLASKQSAGASGSALKFVRGESEGFSPLPCICLLHVLSSLTWRCRNLLNLVRRVCPPSSPSPFSSHPHSQATLHTAQDSAVSISPKVKFHLGRPSPPLRAPGSLPPPVLRCLCPALLSPAHFWNTLGMLLSPGL